MRNKIDLLRYEAKRKPELAALIARAHQLTDEEIDAAPVLKWMKSALRTVRRKTQDDEEVKRLMMSIEEHIVDFITPDPVGKMFRWDGAETFIYFGKSELLVPTGALLWMSDSQPGIWYETAFAKQIDRRLLDGLRIVGVRTKSQYGQDCKAAALARYDASPDARMKAAEVPVGDLGIPGLRITRL